jgi:hypothetical protein
MPSSRQFLEEGYDPTMDACISKAKLLQMFRAALPTTDIGFVIVGAATPSVVTYPELARFLWMDLTGNLYRWNGASWSLVTTSVSIANGSITPLKLSVSGGTPYQILAINSAGTAVTYQSLINLLGTPAYATIPGYGSQLFLTIDSGVGKLSGVDPAAFAAKSIEYTKLSSTGGAIGQSLRMAAAGGMEWFTPTIPTPPTIGGPLTITIGMLSSAGGASGNILVVSGAGFMFSTIDAQITYSTLSATVFKSVVFADVDHLKVVAGPPQEIAHGWTLETPDIVQVRAVCISADCSFSAGDEVDISMVHSTDTPDSPCYRFAVDSTKVSIYSEANTYGTLSLTLLDKGTGYSAGMDFEKWKWKITSIKF